MDAQKTQNQSSPLYILTSNSTRLMIGLKWEPRKANRADTAPSGVLTSLGYVMSIVLWIPSLIISIFTRESAPTPEKLSNQVLYSAQNVDKKDDSTTSRELNFNQYDLDLYCYAYDDQNQFLFVNGPEDENMFSDDGVMYSSGEDFTGRGVYDDESTYIDLK